MSDQDKGNVNPDPAVTQDPSTQGTGVPSTSGTQTTDDQGKMVPYAAMKEEREKRQALQAELDLLKNQTTKVPVASDPMADTRRQLDELWDTDPRRAMQWETQLAFQWYDQINAAVELQEDDVITKHPDYNQFRGEVRKYIRSMPMEQRAKAGVVELAYYAVKGQQVDKIIQKREQEILDRIKAGESVSGFSSGTTSSSAVNTGAVKLTDDQKKAAAALGISEEDYIKNIKK
jgi:hypothetical protein